MARISAAAVCAAAAVFPKHKSRRDVVRRASSLAAVLGAAAFLPGCTQHAMTASPHPVRDIVLVHGAWHGGWCWGPVRTILESAGYRVHTPTLPGLGERAAELDAGIGLNTHIADAERFVAKRGLTNFILVGHSYGGMVITGLADVLKDQIAHIVYLDAALPKDGESMISYGEPRPKAVIDAAEAAIRGMAPDGAAMAPFPAALLGIPADHPLHDWASDRLTPHPLKTWLDPITLRREGPAGLPRTYVHCVEPALAQTQFPYIASQTAADPAWNYRELATGHDAMITDPQGVAHILLEAAHTSANPPADFGNRDDAG